MKATASIGTVVVGLVILYCATTFYLGQGTKPWEPEWPERAAEKVSEIPEDGQRLVHWIQGFFESLAQKFG